MRRSTDLFETAPSMIIDSLLLCVVERFWPDALRAEPSDAGEFFHRYPSGHCVVVRGGTFSLRHLFDVFVDLGVLHFGRTA